MQLSFLKNAAMRAPLSRVMLLSDSRRRRPPLRGRRGYPSLVKVPATAVDHNFRSNVALVPLMLLVVSILYVPDSLFPPCMAANSGTLALKDGPAARRNHVATSKSQSGGQEDDKDTAVGRRHLPNNPPQTSPSRHKVQAKKDTHRNRNKSAAAIDKRVVQVKLPKPKKKGSTGHAIMLDGSLDGTEKHDSQRHIARKKSTVDRAGEAALTTRDQARLEPRKNSMLPRSCRNKDIEKPVRPPEDVLPSSDAGDKPRFRLAQDTTTHHVLQGDHQHNPNEQRSPRNDVEERMMGRPMNVVDSSFPGKEEALRTPGKREESAAVSGDPPATPQSELNTGVADGQQKALSSDITTTEKELSRERQPVRRLSSHNGGLVGSEESTSAGGDLIENKGLYGANGAPASGKDPNPIDENHAAAGPVNRKILEYPQEEERLQNHVNRVVKDETIEGPMETLLSTKQSGHTHGLHQGELSHFTEAEDTRHRHQQRSLAEKLVKGLLLPTLRRAGENVQSRDLRALAPATAVSTPEGPNESNTSSVLLNPTDLKTMSRNTVQRKNDREEVVRAALQPQKDKIKEEIMEQTTNDVSAADAHTNEELSRLLQEKQDELRRIEEGQERTMQERQTPLVYDNLNTLTVARDLEEPPRKRGHAPLELQIPRYRKTIDILAETARPASKDLIGKELHQEQEQKEEPRIQDMSEELQNVRKLQAKTTSKSDREHEGRERALQDRLDGTLAQPTGQTEKEIESMRVQQNAALEQEAKEELRRLEEQQEGHLRHVKEMSEELQNMREQQTKEERKRAREQDERGRALWDRLERDLAQQRQQHEKEIESLRVQQSAAVEWKAKEELRQLQKQQAEHLRRVKEMSEKLQSVRDQQARKASKSAREREEREHALRDDLDRALAQQRERHEKEIESLRVQQSAAFEKEAKEELRRLEEQQEEHLRRVKEMSEELRNVRKQQAKEKHKRAREQEERERVLRDRLDRALAQEREQFQKQIQSLKAQGGLAMGRDSMEELRRLQDQQVKLLALMTSVEEELKTLREEQKELSDAATEEKKGVQKAQNYVGAARGQPDRQNQKEVKILGTQEPKDAWKERSMAALRWMQQRQKDVKEKFQALRQKGKTNESEGTQREEEADTNLMLKRVEDLLSPQKEEKVRMKATVLKPTKGGYLTRLWSWKAQPSAQETKHIKRGGTDFLPSEEEKLHHVPERVHFDKQEVPSATATNVSVFSPGARWLKRKDVKERQRANYHPQAFPWFVPVSGEGDYQVLPTKQFTASNAFEEGEGIGPRTKSITKGSPWSPVREKAKRLRRWLMPGAVTLGLAAGLGGLHYATKRTRLGTQWTRYTAKTRKRMTSRHDHRVVNSSRELLV